MSKIFKSATELIGNTPLVELTNFEKELGLEADRTCQEHQTATYRKI